MFKKIKVRLTWMNAISYFVFLVLFLSVFYFSFAHILNRVQENMLESYAANNMDKFLNVYDTPILTTEFDVDRDKTNFYYVISLDLDVLYGQELHYGFHKVLEENLKPTNTKKFQTYHYDGETLLVMTQAVSIQGEKLGYIAVGQNITMYKQLMNKVLILLIVLLIVSSIGIAALSYFLARKSMAPIQKSYEQQRQFVANASHELRTPLSVLSSSIELFEAQMKKDDVNYPLENMEDIKIEANYMNDMLSSLLYLTRSDQKQIQLNLKELDLSSILIQKTRRIAKTAPHLSFKMEVAEDLNAKVDKLLFEELLYILLKNAVTYTNEGTITVRGKKTNSHIEIEIEDTGIGMKVEDLPHIFERFYRADKIRHSGGTGLGLSIAKTIVEDHHGKITVKTKENIGTTFKVELPITNLKKV